MKKLMIFLLPLILCSIPAFSKDLTTASESDFLNFPGTKSCNITAIHEDFVQGETKLFANVTVELTTGEKAERRVSASFVPVDWAHDDAKKFSKRVIEAYVMCNGKKLESEYTRAERYRYTPLKETTSILLNGTEVKDVDLPLDVKADMTEQQEFKRPDGSIYKASNVAYQVMAVAEHNGKMVGQGELLQLPGGTALEVYKNVYVANESHPSQKVPLYKLLVKVNSTSRDAWVCTKEEQQVTYRGGFFKNPGGTQQLRHFPSLYKLTDSWKEVYKVVPPSTEEISYLKGDSEKTKKFVQTAPKDVGHCDGKYENYKTVG